MNMNELTGILVTVSNKITIKRSTHIMMAFRQYIYMSCFEILLSITIRLSMVQIVFSRVRLPKPLYSIDRSSTINFKAEIFYTNIIPFSRYFIKDTLEDKVGQTVQISQKLF